MTVRMGSQGSILLSRIIDSRGLRRCKTWRINDQMVNKTTSNMMDGSGKLSSEKEIGKIMSVRRELRSTCASRRSSKNS